MFNINFKCYASLHKKSVFMLELMKYGNLWENVVEQNGYELSGVNWEKLIKACLFRFLCVPVSPERRMLLPSDPQGGHLSHETRGLMTCFKGRSESPSCTCDFSNYFSLKYSICQGAFWGA